MAEKRARTSRAGSLRASGFAKVLGGFRLVRYLPCMDTPPPTAAQQKLVMWVLWAAFLIGVCVEYYFLHSKSPPAADESALWLTGALPVLGAVVIRWNVLPRLKSVTPALPLMVVGIALAESAAFIGMFVFPAHQWELFIAAFVGVAQHAPVYAAALFSPPQ